jgi:hypothetical protein
MPLDLSNFIHPLKQSYESNVKRQKHTSTYKNRCALPAQIAEMPHDIPDALYIFAQDDARYLIRTIESGLWTDDEQHGFEVLRLRALLDQ